MLSCIFSDGYCAELRSAIPGVFLRLPIWSSGEEEFALKQSVLVERDDEHHIFFLCKYLLQLGEVVMFIMIA
ncbi:unnamed protein product [Sphagnum jensenii]|uniref:Uncharacterized protein n=1 Tax=Sphagnum jensenii TaxID=128206 RepID=A0ABP0W8H2_9BRYO